MEKTRKEQVVDLLKSIETGATEPAGHINPGKYIQHNPGIADGLAGFGALLSQLPPGSAKVNTVRVFEDGDYVFAHTEYNFFGPKIGFDIFRFEDSKIVEHWDNLQETAGPNPSGHTMTDGVVEIADRSETGANKALVMQFLTDVFINGDREKMPAYFDGDSYLQHNPNTPDNLSGFTAKSRERAAQGITRKYETVHKVLGEGNFVLAVSEGTLAGARTSFYDLFRVQNGKLAEHWDIIETVAPRDTWKNANGKFAFQAG